MSEGAFILIVFDLEGVLIDNRERLLRAIKSINPHANSPGELDPRDKKLFWKAYFDPKLADELDKINEEGIRVLIEKIESKKKIIILSGSPKEIVLLHVKKIREYLKEKGYKVDFEDVIWRPRGDRRKAEEFKFSIIKNILAFKGEIIEEVHDDNPNVIDALKKLSKKAFLWENCKIKEVIE